MPKTGFMAGLGTGIVLAAAFTAAVAGADRLKIHKDAGNSGICLYHAGDPFKCNGDAAEKAELLSADEVERLVNDAKSYCDAKVAKSQAAFVDALEAQKASIFKELGRTPAKAAPKPTTR